MVYLFALILGGMIAFYLFSPKVRRTKSTQKSEQGGLSRETAREILGLNADATSDEVRKKARSLLKKLHTDQGGSDYLARQINEAKTVLLKDKK